jgi:hypothetical protein
MRRTLRPHSIFRDSAWRWALQFSSGAIVLIPRHDFLEDL